ncbi:MAG: PASTA domain-containing protein [Ruminococcus sp.]|nr:PASTA domain-containing protein [Ruminococcus sp.]
MIDRPSERMRRRVLIWLTLLVAVLVGYTVYCIYKVSVKESKKWQTLANSQQLTSTTVSASRGTIYDSQNQVLAQSATVYTVYADCTMLWEFINEKDKKIEDYRKAVLLEDDEDERAKLNEKLLSLTTSQQTYTDLCNFMSDVLKMSVGDFENAVADPSNQYVVLKKEVEKTDADRIEKFLSKNDLDGIRCSPTTKRFYPQNSLAANVIGHTDYDGIGIYGLEAYYDDYLSGVDGRIITASDKFGSEIPYKYKQSYEAQDGASLYLNIDVNVQYYLEKAMAECVAENKPRERACGIIMNPKTGQVYAMATNYSYDPNKPAEITDPATASKLAGLDPESKEYQNERLTAWSIEWKNKAISELYIPGSVFKVITGSAALEEKAITTEDTFFCGTHLKVEDTDFHCWSETDHGGQTLQQAMTNSCNPAFIQIGQRLGFDNFFKYLNAFGFNELTGIDLPGEAYSFTQDPDSAGLVELASMSFGQTNKITPIQMITAYSAVINGGYLVTPQVVNRITDSNGNIVKENSTVVKRQVISEQTSAAMRDILENVVITAPGSNSYIQGYRIGGKSGTSQKIDLGAQGETIYVASYCAFAPADDPEVIMLFMCDEPSGENFYGSQVAAPVCSKVLSDVLPYLGFFPEYTDEELAELEVSVPNVEYRDIDEAKKTISDLGLEVTVIGSGDVVLRQSPMGATVQRGGSVVLYTDNTTPAEMVSVPNVEGLSKEYARELLHSVGLNMTVDGSVGTTDANVFATENIMTGRTVPVGTAIPVAFEPYTVSSQ